MRKIKFRAFLKEKNYSMPTNKMFIPTLSEFNDMDDEIGNLQEVGVVFMQFTGLKDKNGVEIYEGDICKRGEWRPDVVVWLEDDAMFEFKNSWNITLSKNHLSDVEVIGNIYENPELLETK